MGEVLRYRDRPVTEADVAFIRRLIAAHPGASRRALSVHLCRAWDWRQANGAWRDMVCRGLMLALDRAGHIALPPRQQTPPNPFVTRTRPEPVALDATPIRGRLRDLGPLTFRSVRRTQDEALFDGLIETHHYLGYTQPVGEQLKILVTAEALGARPVACFAWSSAPRHLGPRDRHIGWSQEARRRNLRFLAYNPRYLILPWVTVRYLASHLLSRMTRELSALWERAYGHPVYFAETFVDPARFRGSCYRAAGWTFLGATTGRGKDAPTRRPTRPKKEVLGLALTPRFRTLLSQGAAG
jgi:hypothetical protein